MEVCEITSLINVDIKGFVTRFHKQSYNKRGFL